MNQSISIFVAVAIAGLFYAGGQYIASEPSRNEGRVVTVQATGESKSTPNIGHVTLGVDMPAQPTSQEATDMLATKINAVLAAVRALGIAEEDIKTQNLSVQPTYDYVDGKQELRGYTASQHVIVTVRKTELVGDVVARATGAGANQIGGVSFENEDSQAGIEAAEQDAIVKARKKGEALAGALGVRLGKVKNYSVQQGYGGPVPYALEAKAVGMGGDSVTPPDVPVGTQESQVTVTITYEIK